jgi:hypothetical protein
VRWQESPLTRLVDEEGKLFNEQQKLEVFRGSHTLLVPPDVQIERRSPSPETGAPKRLCIVYPVPEHWSQGVISAEPLHLIGTNQWTYEKGERFSTQSLLARARKGFGVARGGANPAGLLDSFLRLADKDLDLSKQERHEYVKTRVAAFVKRWGPLWLCTTSPHAAHGRRCYWHPREAFYWGGTTTPCTWHPVEEVYAFLDEARQAKTALETMAELKGADQEGLFRAVREASRAAKEGRADPSSIQDWQPLLQKRQSLIERINKRLRIHRCLGEELLWLPDMREPTMRLAHPIGFLPAVWSDIAHMLCGAKGPYRCDDCQELYVRKGRQPKTGQNQYCDACREGNRGAAKIAMRQQRAAARARDSQ